MLAITTSHISFSTLWSLFWPRKAQLYYLDQNLSLSCIQTSVLGSALFLINCTTFIEWSHIDLDWDCSYQNRQSKSILAKMTLTWNQPAWANLLSKLIWIIRPRTDGANPLRTIIQIPKYLWRGARTQSQIFPFPSTWTTKVMIWSFQMTYQRHCSHLNWFGSYTIQPQIWFK